jgi:hypothetical protein
MLLEQIDADMVSALKTKNEIVLSSLRNLKAAFQNVEIEKRRALSDEDAISAIAKKVKQHKDSIASFLAGNRQDLVAIETAQMQVLEKYLPQQMSETEVAKIVSDAIAKLQATPADFGKVMKEVVSQVKGQADGSVISRLVREQLK